MIIFLKILRYVIYLSVTYLSTLVNTYIIMLNLKKKHDPIFEDILTLKIRSGLDSRVGRNSRLSAHISSHGPDRPPRITLQSSSLLSFVTENLGQVHQKSHLTRFLKRILKTK